MLSRRRATGGKTFFNVAVSYTGTRNNCGPQTTPTSATYTVPAGTYQSTISQADADAMAQADINANAQNYINANAYCTPWQLYTVRPFASAGTYSWTVPAGVTSVDVFLVGGGGAGGGYGSGGGGGYTKTFLNIPVTPGQAVQVIIGAGVGGTTQPPATGGYSQFLSSSYRANGGASVTGSSSLAGSGGSGGGYRGAGGSDGASGAGSSGSSGTGQGTTTKDFGSGTVNAGGGGAYYGNTRYQGGASGYSAGKGEDGKAGQGGTPGGYGGGGYGGGGGASDGWAGGKGGDGTCVIRYYAP